MIEKLKELVEKDELLPHKLGLSLGSLIGLVLGMIISDRADEVEYFMSTEENADVQEDN